MLYIEDRGGMQGIIKRREKSHRSGRRLPRDGSRKRAARVVAPSVKLPECPICRRTQQAVEFRLNYDLVGAECPICLMPREAAMMAHIECGHTMCEPCARTLIRRGGM